MLTARETCLFSDPEGGEPFLLTPGPLTTSATTKRAAMRDWGSWDSDFRAMTAELRRRLLALANAGPEWCCVPMQGSGTFAVEAMLGTLVPRDARTLVLANGAYGQRCVQILQRLGRDHRVIDKGDYLPPRGPEVAALLDHDPSISHVVVVHCETSSGILNPIEEIAEVVAKRGRHLLIDSMSAFGALPVDLGSLPCDALVSSANKCIEGIPGFGFVLVREAALMAAEGVAHSLSLDLYDQWAYMERTGQWRYTPPTHAIAAFLAALDQHEAEGGQAGRLQRYRANRDALVTGMRAIGFETLLEDRWLSPIIVTFFEPADPAFDFQRFYDALKRRGFIIYPGKLTVADSFRIGCIGWMDATVMERVVRAAGEALAEFGVRDAAPTPAALGERAKLQA